METKVLIGVDPHKATNVVAALDELGELLERTEFPADRKGLRTLERWAARFPKRRWAIEGGKTFWAGLWPTGRPLAAKKWWMSHPSSRRG
jgi:transposase